MQPKSKRSSNRFVVGMLSILMLAMGFGLVAVIVSRNAARAVGSGGPEEPPLPGAECLAGYERFQ